MFGLKQVIMLRAIAKQVGNSHFLNKLDTGENKIILLSDLTGYIQND